MKIETFKHGTVCSYNKGCRCSLCREAKSNYRKNSPIKGHGTKWYYDKGCRCELCKDAKSKSWKKCHPNARPRATNMVDGTRRCYKCGVIKSLNDFSNSKKLLFGKSYECKVCHNERARTSKKIYEPLTTGIDGVTRRCSICKETKPLDTFGLDKYRMLGRSYECKDCHNRRGRVNKNKPGQRFSTYRSGAKFRHIEFDLSFKQFMIFWCKSCYYCGTEINGIGLDRKDSKDGYNMDNIVPCCRQCNMAKTIQTPEQFISMCLKVAKKFQDHIVGPIK